MDDCGYGSDHRLIRRAQNKGLKHRGAYVQCQSGDHMLFTDMSRSTLYVRILFGVRWGGGGGS